MVISMTLHFLLLFLNCDSLSNSMIALSIFHNIWVLFIVQQSGWEVWDSWSKRLQEAMVQFKAAESCCCPGELHPISACCIIFLRCLKPNVLPCKIRSSFAEWDLVPGFQKGWAPQPQIKSNLHQRDCVLCFSLGFLQVSGYSFYLNLSVNQLQIYKTWMIQCKKTPNICEAVVLSCDHNTDTVSRKLILQASEQNVNSAWYARPVCKCRSIMRKQSQSIVV